MKTIAFFTSAALALIASALPSAPVVAQPGGEPRIAVAYADLDLTTAEGRAALDLRLLHAARTACGTPSPSDPRGRANLDACVADARVAAEAQRDQAVALASRQAQPTLASR